MDISGILQVLTKSNSAALLITVIGAFSLTFVREYFRTLVRLREIQHGHKTSASDAKTSDTGGEFPYAAARGSTSTVSAAQIPTTAGDVVGFNFRLLERYYDQHLIEYK